MIQFFLISIALAGLCHVYFVAIQVGQIFQFMQKPLVYLQGKNEFMYKRLGGCPTCTLQTFIDVYFIGAILTQQSLYIWYTWFLIWLFVSGVSHYCFAVLIALMEQKQVQKVEQEKIDL